MPASATAGQRRPERPEELVEGLSSLDTNARLKALRDVKNQIIGNKTKKLSYIKLGAVPRVVEILASDTETPLLVQSAAAVGSFACGIDAGVQAVLDSGVLPHLLRTLSNGDDKVVEAGARSLRMILQSTLAPRGDLWEGGGMDPILALLASPNHNLAEVASSVVARCCTSLQHQQAVVAAGGMAVLVRLLDGSANQRQGALDALVALTRNNAQNAFALMELEEGRYLRLILQAVKDKVPRLRLLACLCATTLMDGCPGVMGKRESAVPTGEFGPGERGIQMGLLATLLKLLHEPGQVGEEAPAVLEALVAHREELQRVAGESSVVPDLAALLAAEPPISAQHCQSLLRALAALCSRWEGNRRQLFEHKAWSRVLGALHHEEEGVRLAACTCLRSAARSIKNLRTGLSGPKVVVPLLELLRDPFTAVQAAAAAALCNVVLQLPPGKGALLLGGGLPLLADLGRSMEPVLRLHGAWALKNLAFMADLALKDAILEELGPATLLGLVQDPEEEVQEQALALLRNIAHGRAEDAERVAGPHRGALLHAVARQVEGARRAEVCLQAVSTLRNVASGTAAHRDAVLACIIPSRPSQPGPLSSLLHRFLHEVTNPQLRLAALCCLENLSHPESPGAKRRVARLREAGLEDQLRLVATDPCLELKTRALAALDFFALADRS